jgi:ribosome-binding factor A
MKEIRKMKLESLILRELSGLIQRRRIKDDRIGLVSISRVNLAPDLSTMTVYISLFGEEKENRLTWKALLDASGFLQSTVGKNLRLRVTPKLRFEIDETIKEGDRIIDLIESGRTGSESAGDPSGE